jgi:pyruvate dehydrogenase E2 component (dihydrolipoamide acetyltransferase)
MAEFRMPSLGSDMEAGTLVEWRVKPGDYVRRRDIVAVVDTDKAAIEIEVYEDGLIESLLVQPGQTVPVGTVMAVIRTEAAGAAVAPEGEPRQEANRLSPEPEDVSEAEIKQAPPAISASGTRGVKASPYARKLAAERGVDLSTVKGTGADNAVCAADLERATGAATAEPAAEIAPSPIKEARAGAQEPPTAPPSAEPAGKDYRTAMRRAIAAAMTRSKREIPHYYLQTRIDMHRTLSWLTSENEKRSIKDRILPVVPLIRAVARALGDVPELNGHWIDDRHERAEAIHIGFIISLRRGGIIAPAILDADAKSPDELMAALRDLITRARSGGLRGAEMTDATITITNLGDLGVETVYGIIYPPQVALVGFGRIMEQPWAEDGMLGVRPVLTATLAADHRATDGHRGAQFLDALNHYLQETPKP